MTRRAALFERRPSRDLALDIAKGLAIVAIVVGHVLRGLHGAGLVSASAPWYEEVDTALYLVHLPVFFLLSGLFVARAAQRDGVHAYLRSRLGLMAWLFVTWTLVQGFLKVTVGGLANTPVEADDLLMELLRPDSQLWFLPTLMTFTLATVLLAPWRSNRRLAVTLLASGLVSVSAWGIFGTWSFTKGAALLVFFSGGVVLGHRHLGAWLTRAWVPAVGLLSSALFAAVCWLADPTPPSTMFHPRSQLSVLLGITASTAGTVALLVAARLLGSVPGARLLGMFGRRSLEIFLAHIICAAGTRIVLQQWGVESVPIHATAGVLAGVAGPLLLAVVLERVQFPWLFAAPSWLTGRAVIAR